MPEYYLYGRAIKDRMNLMERQIHELMAAADRYSVPTYAEDIAADFEAFKQRSLEKAEHFIKLEDEEENNDLDA